MRRRPHISGLFLILALLLSPLADARAEEAPETDAESDTETQAEELEEELTRRDRPLRPFISLNLHNYYRPLYPEVPGLSTNVLWVRTLANTGPVLFRLSVPIRSAHPPDETLSGLGNSNLLILARLTRAASRVSVLLGPVYQMPTATDPRLGKRKHDLGAATVVIGARKGALVGALASYQHSVAGDPDVRPNSLSTFQPLVFLQLERGYYLRSTAITVVQYNERTFHLPVGLGAGKLIPVGRTLVNLFLEPQMTVASKGERQPAFHVYAGINFLFTPPDKVQDGKQPTPIARRRAMARQVLLSSL